MGKWGVVSYPTIKWRKAIKHWYTRTAVETFFPTGHLTMALDTYSFLFDYVFFSMMIMLILCLILFDYYVSIREEE